MTITANYGRSQQLIADGRPATQVDHAPVGVYERCNCDISEYDYAETHFAVDGVGTTCFRGLLFHICSSCCADPGLCSQHHDHGLTQPPCPTSNHLITAGAVAS